MRQPGIAHPISAPVPLEDDAVHEPHETAKHGGKYGGKNGGKNGGKKGGKKGGKNGGKNGGKKGGKNGGKNGGKKGGKYGGVNDPLAVETAVRPYVLSAVTVNVYAVLDVRPVTVKGEETPETVRPPGEEVTVYVATVLPSYAD
ncbi:hypothetical protein UFOVP1217_40 [uncultured Caudovirales phage]|uniref:Uncharacterized protein n=1 Tax=uncultured Caudovirales phage TaxID=2100421 RepID=A0A6J5NIT0_9CAUD|nr:hypothetical protein UFOVP465_118 [uncultured Caudovirales phage]CAB4156798.1 hypothetical protein UFOVP666_164 [uncultured Caudovirales phage]CAB4160086.1 hypothetical protein UFOVP727_53 [uncultured Caudovirales phage]CAB4164285.1 hypothetical protein UFOVP819_4 [uncultured Caudovirales phage]CAB4172240.1 hypothetical protein UFOVP926_83 [uncultured Caudovirales phage]